MLGTAAVLSMALLYPGYKQQKAGAAELDYLLRQPHNPDKYRFPICHSRDHDGWGLYRAKSDYNWYVIRPDSSDAEVIASGHWSQYDELSNLYCEES